MHGASGTNLGFFLNRPFSANNVQWQQWWVSVLVCFSLMLSVCMSGLLGRLLPKKICYKWCRWIDGLLESLKCLCSFSESFSSWPLLLLWIHIFGSLSVQSSPSGPVRKLFLSREGIYVEGIPSDCLCISFSVFRQISFLHSADHKGASWGFCHLPFWWHNVLPSELCSFLVEFE